MCFFELGAGDREIIIGVFVVFGGFGVLVRLEFVGSIGLFGVSFMLIIW